MKLKERIIRAYSKRPWLFVVPSVILGISVVGFGAMLVFRPKPNPLIDGCHPIAYGESGTDACEITTSFGPYKLIAEDWAEGNGYQASSPDNTHLVLKGKQDSYEIVAGKYNGEEGFALSSKGPVTVLKHHRLTWSEKAVETVKDAGVR